MDSFWIKENRFLTTFCCVIVFPLNPIDVTVRKIVDTRSIIANKMISCHSFNWNLVDLYKVHNNDNASKQAYERNWNISEGLEVNTTDLLYQ